MGIQSTLGVKGHVTERLKASAINGEFSKGKTDVDNISKLDLSQLSNSEGTPLIPRIQKLNFLISCDKALFSCLLDSTITGTKGSILQ